MRLRPRRLHRLGALASAIVALLAPSNASGEGASGASLRILDVPYLTQTPELCGGAAAAMVLRYWGDPAATSDFAALVDPLEHGIPTSALVEAIRQRGMAAVPFRAERDLVRGQLERGRPVIGLIGVGAGRFHYVVILAWANERVLLHDPAQSPFRVYKEHELLTSWRASDFWAVVVSRGETAAEPVDASRAEAAASTPSPCSTLVQHGVALSRSGEAESAETSLHAAVELCPDSAAPLLELAGLRFQSQRWTEAAELARQASRLDPEDTHAWRTLAASRYLSGDEQGALPAFNRLAEPKLGVLRIDGLTRTRFAVLEKRLATAPESLLTARTLERTRRRLSDVPALRSSRVSYRPTADGHADLEVAVAERSLFPGKSEIARLAARAWNEREVEVGFASPTHSGELVSLAWRFWEPRPAFGLKAAVPQPLGAPLLLLTEIRWDTQSYRLATPAIPVREEQREVALAVSDWALARVKWELGASLQRFQDRASFLGPIAALEGRAAREHLAARVDAAALRPLHDAAGFATLRLAAAWRSAAKETAVLRLRAEWAEASSAAPLAAWSGAGTGAGRAALLRAHPLLEEGIVTGEVFGRRLVHGGLELEPAGFSAGVARLGLVLFTDASRATRRDQPGAAGHVDAGVGLRMRLPGSGGSIRIDAARGLRDGAHAYSAGWVSRWPAFGGR